MRTQELAYLANTIVAGSTLPEDFLVNHDLIRVFQVGWTVLHADVSMYAAERLIEVLTDCEMMTARFKPDSTRFGSKWGGIGATERRGVLATRWT